MHFDTQCFPGEASLKRSFNAITYFDCVALPHWLLNQIQLGPLQSPLLLLVAVPDSHTFEFVQKPQPAWLVQLTQLLLNWLQAVIGLLLGAGVLPGAGVLLGEGELPGTGVGKMEHCWFVHAQSGATQLPLLLPLPVPASHTPVVRQYPQIPWAVHRAQLLLYAPHVFGAEVGVGTGAGVAWGAGVAPHWLFVHDQ
jgi:hypothetical protein